jgi:hypothetical protein
MIIETAPDAASAEWVGSFFTGGGNRCLWISAVNNAGESQRVAGTCAP